MDVYEYAVVKFTDDNDSVGVVCTSWIAKEKDITYYPKSGVDIVSALKKKVIPTIDWPKHPIKVLKEYVTLEEARSRLNKAEETSNLDSDTEDAVRRKKVPKRYLSEDYDSDDLIAVKLSKFPRITQYPPLRSFEKSPTKDIEPTKTPVKEPFHARPCCSQSLSSPIVAGSSSQSQILVPDKLFQVLDNNRVVLGQLQATVADLVQEIGEINRKLDILLAKDSGGSRQESNQFSNEMILLGKLPITSSEDFDDNEDSLQDARYHNLLVKVLVSLGGKDCRTFTYNMLRRLMTCQLATKFSFTGKQPKDKLKEKKRSFGDTLLYKSVQASARKVYPNTKEDEIKSYVSLWLQQALHRIKQRGNQTPDSPSGLSSIFNSEM